MLVFKDVVSDDEMFSDSHRPVLIDDVIYEVNAKMVVVSNAVDSKLIGANPSGEEGEEEVNDTTERVIDLVHGNRLVETSFTKKDFLTYLKAYLKRIKANMEKRDPSKVKEFEASIQNYMKKVLEKFNDYQFFTGESMNPEGMVALMNYREDGITPYFIFFKDGLVEEKYSAP